MPKLSSYRGAPATHIVEEFRAGAWRPAVHGTLNQTGLPDAEASMAPSEAEAQELVDAVHTLDTEEMGEIPYARGEVRVRALDEEVA